MLGDLAWGILSNLIHYANPEGLDLGRKMRGPERNFKGEIENGIEYKHGDLDRQE